MGFEPTASTLARLRSNQLSYIRMEGTSFARLQPSALASVSRCNSQRQPRRLLMRPDSARTQSPERESNPHQHVGSVSCTYQYTTEASAYTICTRRRGLFASAKAAASTSDIRLNRACKPTRDGTLSHRDESNAGPPAYKAEALPLSYGGKRKRSAVELPAALGRRTGIEPASLPRGPGRIRTDSLLLAKQLLYHWSY